MREPEDKNLNAPDHGMATPSQAHPSIGYEASDVNVSGVMVFLASLAGFLLVFFVFCYVLGMVINNGLVKHDGPANKWHQLGAVPHQRGKSMASTTAMEQQQLQTMTQRFPTPRLQMDDGNQDLADMHQKEDLLLDHYTWVDKSQGKVRIPIDRAMELIVQRGLPVAPQTAPANGDNAAASMDEAHSITPPLTNGFARTTYEQDEAAANAVKPESRGNNQVSSNGSSSAWSNGSSNKKRATAPTTAGGIQ
jgi:hypothetical protein